VKIMLNYPKVGTTHREACENMLGYQKVGTTHREACENNAWLSKSRNNT
jgi:hypothetical protein